MVRRLLLPAAACAAGLLAVGCGGAEVSPGLEGRVEFVRSGGLDGRIQRLTIEPDGRAVLATARMGVRRFRLRPEELESLRDDLARVDLGAVPAESRTPRPVPDAFGYQLRYRGRTVTADQTAVPDELSALLPELSALVDRSLRP